MANHTINIDVHDISVPELNPINIAIINLPNPVIGYSANAKEVRDLIQIPKYTIYESGTSTWNGVSTSTLILVPVDSYGAYTSASNYPSPSNYTYLGFGTYTSRDTLPATTQDELYTLTWYASMADAVAETNPITEGNGEEVYARAVAV